MAAAILLGTAGCGGGGAPGTAARGPTAGFPGASPLPAALAGRPAPRIRLRDARGGTLDTGALHGTPYAVTFLYARCPDVCPLIASEIGTALRSLGPDAARVRVVAVSVDPRGDTPAAVREFLRRHRAGPQFRYLIGSRAELAPVWRDWYAAPQIPGRPESSHTAAIWLVGAGGRLAAEYPAGMPLDPAALAASFRTLLARRG